MGAGGCGARVGEGVKGPALLSGPVRTTLCLEGVTPEAPGLGLRDQGLLPMLPSGTPFPCQDGFTQPQCPSVLQVTAFIPGRQLGLGVKGSSQHSQPPRVQATCCSTQPCSVKGLGSFKSHRIFREVESCVRLFRRPGPSRSSEGEGRGVHTPPWPQPVVPGQ